MTYYLKRLLKLIIKYFIDEIINLCAFIVLIGLSFVIVLNIDDAGIAMGIIGILLLALLIIATYISCLYHRKKG